MAYKNLKALNEAYDAGNARIFGWRKAPTQTTGSGIWFDLSMSPGNPVPNYYAAAPVNFQFLKQSTDGGLYHGLAPPSGTKKYLKMLQVMSVSATAVPLPMILCDYLGYYPFVDMSITGEQEIFNTNSLTRYTTGAGVQMMAVEVAAQIGGTSFFVTYTNSDGVAGRITPTVTCNTQVVNGTLVSTAPTTLGCSGPFIPLQTGDSGVRSIQSVNFLTGDVGLITLVLVKPLADIAVHDITAPAEKDFFIEGMSPPIIEDDAYLNFIVHPSGTLASTQIMGLIETVWV